MKRAGLVLAAAAALLFLYFFGLTRTGLIGFPDEPRYAAIGRAMAATGDWITPRLWGAAWFEKPALLYWMTAAGFKLGLGPDLAPRLPVAIASVAFLIYFFTALRREFGDRAAWYSAAILATSAGWLAYSHVAITDLPMSAAFGAAMFVLIAGRPGARTSLIAGALLGLAVLAKGLVPLVLFIPALWFLRNRIRDLAIVFTAAIVVAVPWYALVTLRNGTTFLNEFIWKHHFGRFLNSATAARTSSLVLCAGFTSCRAVSLDTAAGSAVPTPPLSGSACAVSSHLVRLGLPLLLDFAQQTAGLFVAVTPGAGRFDGNGAGQRRACTIRSARLRIATMPCTGAGRDVAASAGGGNFPCVVPSGLAWGDCRGWRFRLSARSCVDGDAWTVRWRLWRWVQPSLL